MQSILKSRVLATVASVGFVALSSFAVGCGDDDGGTSGTGAMDAGGTGGTGGTGGASGAGATGGTGGDTDDSGIAGTGGTGGTGGGEPCDPSLETTDVTANLTADTHWTCGTYTLKDIIYVTGNHTLTIDPGVRIEGDADLAEEGQVTALIITRGSQINAVGTADEPIVFTSSKNPGKAADWGGLVLLGQATLNSPNCVGSNAVDCAGGHWENVIEGLDPVLETSKFGGTDDASSCGTLKYARIEYAGFELQPNVELNGLSVGACGSGTTISYVQVLRGSDDGIEMFGGTAGMDHVVISFSNDDGLDWDLGWRGKVQFLVVHQEPGCTGATCDNGFEADNLGDNEIALPTSKPTIFNATLVGSATQRGMLLREGTQGVLRNMLVTGFSTAVDIRDLTAPVSTFWPGDLSIEQSCFFSNTTIGDADADLDDDQGFVEDDAIKAGARNNVFTVDPMLASVAVAGPDYRPASTMLGGKATPPAGMDTSATYCGAFEHGGDDWMAGWTAFPIPRE